MKTLNEIFTANEKIYPHTDKRIEQNRIQKSDHEFNLYLNDLQEDFYIQINEMIIFLQSENLMLQQRDRLIKHLIGMTDYYFNQMSEEVLKISNWEFIQEFDMKLEGKQDVYITPKQFTKEYVLEKVHYLFSKTKSESKRDKNKTFNFWVELAIKMATNEVKLSYENTNDWGKTAIELFGEKYNEESKPLKIGSVRNYISQTHCTNDRGLWAVKNKIEILEKAVSIIEQNPSLEIENTAFSENLKKNYIADKGQA